MRFNAIIFDFDGCLVDSTRAKYDAFFDVFPPGDDCRRVVTRVLLANPDGSRYDVIPRMAHLMLGAGLALEDDRSDEARIAAYGANVLVAVAACPAFSRAEELLRLAKKVGSVYISSNTPEVALRDLVERRGWLPLVDAVYGYPRRKGDTVRQIVSDCGGRGDHVLVVGDGVSDEAAARDNGCVFVAVNVSSGLAPAFAVLETNDVPG
jgi:phosphoglycolate phosphatase-like HAD superfamily hydrolase